MLKLKLKKNYQSIKKEKSQKKPIYFVYYNQICQIPWWNNTIIIELLK